MTSKRLNELAGDGEQETAKPPTARRPPSTESGNAFYIILIGVVLFAALMFVFAKNARQGSGNMTKKQAEMNADGIMDYAQTLNRAVSRLMQSGNCSETSINFVTPVAPDYPDNAMAPADKSCNVFDKAGGAVTAQQADTLGSGLKIRPSGGASFRDVGTWDATTAAAHQDLVVWFGPLTLDICNRLNTMGGYSGTPPAIATAEAWAFGQLVGGGNWGSSNLDTGALAGKDSGCLNVTDVPSSGNYLDKGYQFYYVLWSK